MSSLLSKMDQLQLTVNTLVSQRIPRVHGNFQEGEHTTGLNIKEIHWDQIKNLTDLLSTVDILCSEKRLNSLYVRCNACYKFITSVDGIPFQKRIKRHDSFAYGLKVAPACEEDFFFGRGKKWIKFKHNAKKHCSGAETATADLHCRGLRMLADDAKEESAKFKIHKVFVKAAVEVIKTKVSAENFETTLAYYHSLGVQIGNIQHSRKTFPLLLDVICQTIDSVTVKYMQNCLDSTGAQPHYCITFDKSTVNRSTNQAIIIMAMVEGKRTAWFLDAPLVYSVEDGETELSGGRSESLAFQIKSSVLAHLPDINLCYCQGAVADGQYQNKKFVTCFHKEFEWPLNQFNFIMWDAGHFLDLAVKNLNSSPFMKRLLRRTQLFHTKLGYGKMHQIAATIGTSRGLKTLRTSSASQTRFATSQVNSMERIIKCFPQYIEALYEYGGMKRSSDEEYDEEEYMVCGQDFLLDLLGLVDSISPVVELMEISQNLQSPGWKIVPNGLAATAQLKTMMEDIEKSGQSWEFPSERWPYLSVYSTDILQMKYKGVELVDGWMTETTGTQVTKAVNWTCRQQEDCKADLKEFLKNLIDGLEARFSSCIPKGLTDLYHATDISQFVAACAGKWCAALKKPLITGITEESKKSFLNFYTYVKSLPHSMGLEDNGLLVLAQTVTTME